MWTMLLHYFKITKEEVRRKRKWKRKQKRKRKTFQEWQQIGCTTNSLTAKCLKTNLLMKSRVVVQKIRTKLHSRNSLEIDVTFCGSVLIALFWRNHKIRIKQLKTHFWAFKESLCSYLFEIRVSPILKFLLWVQTFISDISIFLTISAIPTTASAL